MVRGKRQPSKIQRTKRNSTVTNKPAIASPAQPPNKNKAAKQSSLISCSECGVVITEDVKALQCDRCQTAETWKCTDCLNIPADMYEHMVSDPNCSLRWFCVKCDKVAISAVTICQILFPIDKRYNKSKLSR